MINYKDCEDEDDNSIFLMDLDYDPESKIPDETCPNCGNEYDEIDYEYQICHYCKFENMKRACGTQGSTYIGVRSGGSHSNMESDTM